MDTSAIFALASARDACHRQATSFLKKCRSPLVTTNLIFAESLCLITKRASKPIAVEVGRKLRASQLLRIANLDDGHLDEAWKLFASSPDKEWDYIDCASFVFMRRRNIDEAFAFDEHFRQGGFRMVP